jgi:predicted amidohydrolase YtcJ
LKRRSKKLLVNLASAFPDRASPNSQEFLGSFFQKRTALRLAHLGSYGTSAKTLLVSAASAVLCAAGPAPPANIVFLHGRIHTQDAARHVVQALAISGNTIAATGTDESLQRWIGRATRVIDLGGRTMLPGLIDAHVHPAESAEDLDHCNLQDAPLTLATLRNGIAKCLAAQNDHEPVLTIDGVNPSDLSLKRSDLDSLAGARPLLLSGSDGHTIWINSAAMRLAGITAATPAPHGGRIEHDADGNPTGTMRDSATDLVIARLPPPDVAANAGRTARVFDQMHAVGITAVQDARVNPRIMATYKQLYDTHRLDMRVRGCFHLADLSRPAGALIADAIKFRAAWAIDPALLHADCVKIFADGVIEFPSQTAALLTPYLDRSGKPTTNTGPTYATQDNFNMIAAAADRAGLGVHVHAIGDRAVRSALDAFAYARAANGVTDNRHQIAHLELVDQADVPRFHALNVIANLQLDWAEHDPYIDNATIPFIGPRRAQELYPARSLGDAGAIIAGGSDWSVSTFNPFIAMQHGMNRTGETGGPLLPEEGLTLQNMVDAYTINAAYALKSESLIGSLEPGKRADLTIIDRDIFALQPDAIARTIVTATWFDGRQLFPR